MQCTESHNIKNSSTKQSHACNSLSGDRRWLLSGTPLHTTIDDVLAQLSFLNISIASDSPSFARTARRCISIHPNTLHVPSEPPPELVCTTISTIFQKLMMRHIKGQTFAGRDELIRLPPKHMETIKIDLNPIERTAYNELYDLAKKQFDRMCERNEAIRKTIQVMALLLPLRQACSGGTVDIGILRAKEAEFQRIYEASLKKHHGDHKAAENDVLEYAKSIAYNIDDECTICLEVMQDILQTPCNHAFCGECISAVANSDNPVCPLCRSDIDIDELKPPPPPPPPKVICLHAHTQMFFAVFTCIGYNNIN